MSDDTPLAAIDPAEEIADTIHALRHLFGARQYRGIDGDALSHMEGRVLAWVSRCPGTTLSALTGQLSRDKGQVARLIAGLRQRGLVVARSDAFNRRIQRLDLTEEGRAVDSQARAQRSEVAHQSMIGIADDERLHLLAMLGRMRVNLDALP